MAGTNGIGLGGGGAVLGTAASMHTCQLGRWSGSGPIGSPGTVEERLMWGGLSSSLMTLCAIHGCTHGREDNLPRPPPMGSVECAREMRAWREGALGGDGVHL